MKNIKILFIGNSHTFYNDLPLITKRIFASAGINAEVVMLTQGGKCLDYHYSQQGTRFNILYGDYDYIVLQGKATNFNPETYTEYGKKIYDEFISKTHSKIILYSVWANQGKKHEQAMLTNTPRELVKYTGGSLAPAGEVWQSILNSRPAPRLYSDDGNHATPLGSYLAAVTVFYAVTGRSRALNIKNGDEPHSSMDIDTSIARAIHSRACKITLEYNKA